MFEELIKGLNLTDEEKASIIEHKNTDTEKAINSAIQAQGKVYNQEAVDKITESVKASEAEKLSGTEEYKGYLTWKDTHETQSKELETKKSELDAKSKEFANWETEKQLIAGGIDANKVAYALLDIDINKIDVTDAEAFKGYLETSAHKIDVQPFTRPAGSKAVEQVQGVYSDPDD